MFYRRAPVSSGVNYKSESASALPLANERLDDAPCSPFLSFTRNYFVSIRNRFEHRHRLARRLDASSISITATPLSLSFSLSFAICHSTSSACIVVCSAWRAAYPPAAKSRSVRPEKEDNTAIPSVASITRYI